ncbi:MAG: MobF family relaxase [Acidimicrobiales bacterium]
MAATLSIGKANPTYYLDKVAEAPEDYYLGAKEAPGQWLGQGAARLGLAGQVGAEGLLAVMAGRHPGSGDLLTRAQSKIRVAAFDLTFRAPKSVSLLFALGEGHVRSEVGLAHDVAMRAALGYLEEVADRARRGKGGTIGVDGEGFVAAAFQHRISRAADPHLHTHVLVANLTRGPDGRWSALDGRALYHQAKTAGTLYEAQLRAELTRRLGVSWGPVSNGIADLAGIPVPVLRAFSQRRADIEAEMARRGTSSARAAQVATLATRPVKELELCPEGLEPAWRERATALGLDEQALASLTGPSVVVDVPAVGSPVADVLFATLASPEGLTAKEASFGPRDVLQAIANAHPQGIDVDRARALAEAFLASDHVVSLTHGQGTEVLRRVDGVVVPAALDEGRYSTPEMLLTEARLLATAVGGRDAGVARVDQAVLAMALGADAGVALSAEQRGMVTALTTSGAGVEVVVGQAGSGKTAALASARVAWESAGYKVLGAALAARAAAELQAGSGIPSITLARLLKALERPGGPRLGPGTVIVADEAAMIGTRQLARLADHAQASGAKLVLVGDDHQLPSIEAGGSFSALLRRLPAIELTDNRRQVEVWERQALSDLRAGRAEEALDAYRDNGALHRAESAGAVREQVVSDWWASSQRGESGLMLARRRSDVVALNAAARGRMAGSGELGAESLVVEGRSFAVGDRVLATRNDSRLEVVNGTRGRVTRVALGAGSLTMRTDDGRDLALPATYLGAGHLDHGYALTVHRAQGATLDRAFVLADDVLFLETPYSALSRGRLGNELYLVEDDRRAEDAHLDEATEHPEHALARAVGRSEAKVAASDLGPPASRSRAAQLGERRDALDRTVDRLVAQARRQWMAPKRRRYPMTEQLARRRRRRATRVVDRDRGHGLER